MFSFLLLTLLALTRYVTVVRLFYDNALALTLLSVALYRLCQFLSMFFSLGNVVLSDLALFSADSASLTVAIQLVLYRDHSIVYSRQFHFMPVPSAFLSILYAAMWRSAVPYTIWIHRPFTSTFSSISPLSFPCSFPFHLCAYWVAWHLSTYQPFHLLIMVLFISYVYVGLPLNGMSDQYNFGFIFFGPSSMRCSIRHFVCPFSYGVMGWCPNIPYRSYFFYC